MVRSAWVLLLSADIAPELPGPGPASLSLPHPGPHPGVQPGQPLHHARQGHPHQGKINKKNKFKKTSPRLTRSRSQLQRFTGGCLESTHQCQNSVMTFFFMFGLNYFLMDLKSQFFALGLKICSSTNQFIFKIGKKLKA